MKHMTHALISSKNEETKIITLTIMSYAYSHF